MSEREAYDAGYRDGAFDAEAHRAMGDSEQMSLLMLWPCKTCHGQGCVSERDDGGKHPCPTCHGSGTVEYDPDDHSEIPF